ncbi:hypothetical protein [Nocardia lijiangensis]|uniref:hypothetical protein n=1 Tax=Nocardia lijiangensis TaxID=299618 RepID=UPI00082999B6|nr:hypothetical protein [Nocardia lijiangensis]
MKCGVRMAAGVGIGYLLGRTRKMRLALMLAGVGLSRQAGGPQALLQRGVSALGSSTELTKITDTVRGELMEAARAAAVTAASHQIDALNERLQRQPAASEADEDAGEVENLDKDAYADDEREPSDELEEEKEYEEDTEPEKSKSSASSRARPSTRRRATASRSRTLATASGSGEREPTAARRRRARADTADSAPVRRTRR